MVDKPKKDGGEALCRSELKAVLKNPSYIVIALSPDFEVLGFSEGAVRLYGRDRREVLGKGYFDLYIPEDRWVPDGPELARLWSGDVLDGIETTVKVPRHPNRTVSWTISGMTDEVGEPAALVAIGRDITDDRTRLEQLELFAAAIEDSPDGFQITGPEGRLIYSNQAVEKIYGFSPEELKGRHVNEMNADPTFAERVIIPEILRTGRWEGELTVKHKSGRTFPIWLKTSVIQDEQGRTIALVGNIRDVTSIKRMEYEREAIINTSLDGFMFVGPDRRVLYVNDAYCDMMGYGRDELLNMNIADLEAVESPEEMAGRTKELLEKGGGRFEGHHRRKDGLVLDVEVSTQFIPESQSFFSFVRDITEQKKRRRELRLVREELEARVHERTDELLGSREALTWSEELLALVIENAPAAIVVISADHQVTGFNREAEQAYGLERETVLSSDYRRLFPRAPDGTCGIVNVEKALNGEEVGDFKTLIGSPEGDKRLLSWSIRRLPGIYETGGAVIVIGADITSRTEMENALKESYRLLNAITEGTPDSVSIKDNDGRYVMMNTAGAEMIGWPAAKLIGKSDTEIFPRTQALRIIESDRMTMEKGEVQTVDEILGGRSLVSKKWPMRDDDGTIKGLISIGHDVTEITRDKELSDALTTIDTAITSTLNTDEILRRALVESVKSIGCEAGTIVMREGIDWVLRYVTGDVPKESVDRPVSVEERQFIFPVIETNSMIYSHDTFGDARFNRRSAEKFGYRSFMAQPLVLQNETIGIILFIQRSAPFVFTKAEIDFSGTLATLISLAVKSSRLYASQRDIADKLQETLLSVPQAVEELDFGYLYHSASVAARVGGDFYDLFAIDRARTAVVIGDVSGKGLEAAALTSFTKAVVKAYGYLGKSPEEVISMTNDVICRTTGLFEFITLFYGILDTRTGKLRYASGGHPPGIIKDETGSISYLEYGDPALGIFGDITYTEHGRQLDPRDTLVLYTDGVTEAKCGREFFGEEGLHRAIDGVKGLEAKDITSLIYEKLRDFCHEELQDDVAIITCRWNPESGLKQAV